MTLSTCRDDGPDAARLHALYVRPGLLGEWWARLSRWRRLRHERRQLRELSDEMLRDIGLTREDVERESRRPFWDGGNWRR
ncbi:hypothetical protein L861_11775 [Litchfieldella anticariensis FP35 = DSM 16096]|uniref:YjiS-like domain-containing protein n=1 Tax=Litchfieldella anticariensis (strain DSM 16096 / CECT 5854 / CIP 108499 / LMG 22089 / FP35) TaxID=1121939 RepID=S2L927_LITA3|nr:DUF1127 domain-containing protein [Halomonas anticariensis]EPC01246.1 hypothetical protein L861_11775 [Halomonas anticariensis FP35 = DSM 16096]